VREEVRVVRAAEAQAEGVAGEEDGHAGDDSAVGATTGVAKFAIRGAG
jgi:hypothetical protein